MQSEELVSTLTWASCVRQVTHADLIHSSDTVSTKSNTELYIKKHHRSCLIVFNVWSLKLTRLPLAGFQCQTGSGWSARLRASCLGSKTPCRYLWLWLRAGCSSPSSIDKRKRKDIRHESPPTLRAICSHDLRLCGVPPGRPRGSGRSSLHTEWLCLEAGSCAWSCPKQPRNGRTS